MTEPVVVSVHCGRCRRFLGELVQNPHDGQVEPLRISVSTEGGGRMVRHDPITGKSPNQSPRWWDASLDGWTDGNPTRLKYDCRGKHRSTVGYVTMDRLTAEYHRAVERGDSEILLYS